MSIIPTWPIAAGCLVIGIAVGAGADRLYMAPKLAAARTLHADLKADVAEDARLREVQRAADERLAREEEQRRADRAGEIEQEKEDAINAARSDAAALIARLRQQAASKPANPGGVLTPSAACPAAPGSTLPDRTGEDLVRLAERADQLRAGLDACYKAYDSLTPQ